MSDQPRVPFDFHRMSPQDMVDAARTLAAALAARRSVRDFAPDAVPREVLEHAIAAAGTAPSGANLQPWHFVVVTDPRLKREIREGSEAVEREFYTERITEEWRGALVPLGLDVSKPFLTEAPTVIVVFRRNRVENEGGAHEKTYYPMESVGIATGMLIAALHLSGVATLPYTPSPMGFLRDVLGRPDDDHPFLVLAVGYPAEGATVPALERRSLDDIVTFLDAP